MERDTLRAQRSRDTCGAGPGKRFHLLRQRLVGALAAASQGAARVRIGWLWPPARVCGDGIGGWGDHATGPSPQVLATYGGCCRHGLARGSDCGSRLPSQRRLGGHRDGGRWSRVDRGALEPERLGPNLLPSLGESASALSVSAYLPRWDSNW